MKKYLITLLFLSMSSVYSMDSSNAAMDVVGNEKDQHMTKKRKAIEIDIYQTYNQKRIALVGAIDRRKSLSELNASSQPKNGDFTIGTHHQTQQASNSSFIHNSGLQDLSLAGINDEFDFDDEY